jgi:pSer/pThr/pTyr-binding forkhead associated (FHA) protein
MAFLQIISGEAEGQRFEIGQKELTIGRSPENVIALDDASASGRHCKVVRDADRYWVQDVGSTNGTRVNGAPVGKVRLSPKDIIKIGETEILFDGEDVETEESEARPDATIRMGVPQRAGLAGKNGSPAFEARHNHKVLWMVLGGIAVAVALGAVGYWFLRSLLGG